MVVSKQRMQKASEYLRDCIARTMPGKRLPSVRTMLKKSGVGRAALKIVLKTYEQNGVLRSRSRIGYFRIGIKGERCIDIVACHDEGYSKRESGFIYSCIANLLRTIQEKHYQVRLTSVTQKDSLKKYIEITQYADSCGFVLIEPNMCEIISTFQMTGKPVVVMFPQGRFADVDQVVDSRSIVEWQMEYLLKLGHTRILYLRGEHPFYLDATVLSRRLEYFTIMVENGLAIPSHWVSEYPLYGIREALERTFAKKPYPTALIVYDTEVRDVYAFLKSRKLKIGKDVSVVATDGDSILTSLNPPVTTVISDSIFAAKSVWSLLEKQLAGDFTPKKEELVLTFKEGASSGKPTTEQMQIYNN